MWHTASTICAWVALAVTGTPRKRANSVERAFALAPGGTRTYATGTHPSNALPPRRAASARWHARPTCNSAVVLPVVGGPVTITHGRAPVSWWRPRIIRVRTVREIASIVGVRTTANRE